MTTKKSQIFQDGIPWKKGIPIERLVSKVQKAIEYILPFCRLIVSSLLIGPEVVAIVGDYGSQSAVELTLIIGKNSQQIIVKDL